MPTYKIIGADGKEYGPISSEQLRQWIKEGRANAQTKVLLEGTTEWKPLSEFPDLASALPGPGPGIPPGAPPPLRPTLGTSPFPPAGAGDVSGQVNGPAMGLIIVAILNFITAAASLVLNLAGASMMHMPNMPNMPNEAWVRMFSGTVGIVTNIISVLIGVLILMGGLKMKKLESHGLAVTASILALLPCTSPCCLIGLPIGIWALVVLFRPEVKNSFH